MQQSGLDHLVFGTSERGPESRLLTCGAFRVSLINGSLRQLRWNGVEIVRGIEYPIRGAAWGTVPTVLVEDKLDQTETRIRYTRTFCAVEGKLEGRFSFELLAEGTLRAELELRSIVALETNRAGFTVLHPLSGVCGTNLAVRHSEGSDEPGEFPYDIAPGVIASDITGLEHTVHGVAISMSFGGETFEMEDQRNWGDASFKTYCRPLSLPIPYRIEPAQAIRQTMELTVSGRAIAHETRTNSSPLSLQNSSCPDLLLACEPTWWNGRHAEVLDDTRPQGLLLRHSDPARIDVDWLTSIARSTRTAACYCDLELITSSENMADDLVGLSEILDRVSLRPRHVVAIPQPYLKSYQPQGCWPTGPAPADCVGPAKEAFPDAAIGTGVLTNFVELNRCRPPPEVGDYITHGTSAIVHAADDHSVLQTLEALPWIFAGGRKLAGKRNYRLGLVAIASRTNPYGPDLVQSEGHHRVTLTDRDPRQRGLFAAAYAVGAYAAANEAGCTAIALAGLDGPFAMSDTSASLFPLYHVVKALARAAGSTPVALPLLPEGIRGVSWRTAGKRSAILANCSLGPTAVDIGSPAAFVTLDPESVPDATFSRTWLDDTSPRTDRNIALAPCAIAFISMQENT